jgi:hypothetical protein
MIYSGNSGSEDKYLDWRVTDGRLRPYLGGEPLFWAPQAGSAELFLSCPVYEVLYTGERGVGKSEALLMDFASNVGVGLGSDYTGIILRKTFPELSDIIDKAQRLFFDLFPGLKFNKSEHKFYFPWGEWLQFTYFERESDYWNFHGKQFAYVGWEELTTHSSPVGYLNLMSCLRSPNPDIQVRYRATTNSYGVGQNWVKKRFALQLPKIGPLGKLLEERYIDDTGIEHIRHRIAIRGSLRENKVLLHAQPDYVQNIVMSAKNESQLRSWLYDDWNVTAGGMFDEFWDPNYHVLPSIRPDQIPRRWKIDRSYDHGQSRPFSVGWWAQSNGEPIVVSGRTIGSVPGDIIRFREWYGVARDRHGTIEDNVGIRMHASRIGEGIKDREADMGLTGRVLPGPADASIFDEEEPGSSPAGRFESVGVYWIPSKKGPGTRAKRWELVCTLLQNALPRSGYRDMPGLFVTEDCHDFLRLFPYAPRDETNLDDIDTRWEDHICDEVGYRIYTDPRLVSSSTL